MRTLSVAAPAAHLHGGILHTRARRQPLDLPQQVLGTVYAVAALPAATRAAVVEAVAVPAAAAAPAAPAAAGAAAAASAAAARAAEAVARPAAAPAPRGRVACFGVARICESTCRPFSKRAGLPPAVPLSCQRS